MAGIRRALERLSRGHSFTARLPKSYGGCRIVVSPEASLRFWLPNRAFRSDQSLLSKSVEFVRPGGVVWDVGANIGLFSFASAGLAGPQGRVFAFEPDLLLVKLLRRSARLNADSAPVDVIPCAITSSLSLLRFNIAERSRASNHLDGFGRSQTGGVREVQTVMGVSLDWMAELVPMPDVLKIDVEGAELEVIRGAAKLLKTKRPVILLETSQNSWEEISATLWGLRYTIYDSDIPEADRVPLTKPTFNILAVP
jgi:FkbM family methyltransferase